jgi:hypothetical protein
MSIRLLASAVGDLASGRAFYERQGEGLGSYFLDSVFADIDSLALYKGIHAKVFGYHRLLTRRFPYAVYYKLDADGRVIVCRVLDCRQHPGRTKGALGTTPK